MLGQSSRINRFDFNLGKIGLSKVLGELRVNLDTDREDWDSEETVEIEFGQELVLALGEIVNADAGDDGRADDSHPEKFVAVHAVISGQFWGNIGKSNALDNLSEGMD